MFKIVFFDLDGTLLTKQKEVLEENKIAIQKALDNGIEICVCTGRQKDAAKHYQEMAGTGRYIICANGAEIYDTKDNEQLFQCPIDKNLALNVYEYIMNNNLFARIDTKYGRYITNMNYTILSEFPMEEDYKKFFEENDVLQITVGSTKKEDIDKIVQALNENLKIENRYIVDLFEEDLDMINIVNKSVSKGNAILGLCKYLKINPDEAMAFGDDYNDVSMMEAVYGVAMGNAYDDIKAIAKEIVPTTNNEPGIAQVLNRIIDERKDS